MLDLNNIKVNKEDIEKKYRERGAEILLDSIIELDAERRRCIVKSDELKHLKKEVSREIGVIQKSGQLPADKIEHMKEISQQIKELDTLLDELEVKIREQLLFLPNIPHESVPVGKEASDNREIRRWGNPPVIKFQPKTHIELGTSLGILDFERGAKIAQTRFTLSKGIGARLERALINFMIDIQTRKFHCIEVLPPFLVNRTSMEGTGQLPKFEIDLFKTQDPELYLIPTAEVPLTNIFYDEVLLLSQLPVYLTAYSPCFRKEAGTYGAETRGLIRQHQFNKVEVVKIVTPDTSYDELEYLTGQAEEILRRLNLHYRIMSLCTGDLGFSAAKTYDIEVWCPGQNSFVEISSCSNFEDFQARRARIRYKPAPKAKPEFVHTLNGSALAIGRTVVALLENYQQEDGSVIIPEALLPYLDGVNKIEKNEGMF
ncbi:MAG: serine--tRNA ligase [Candidatus Fischerbacteria bacterium RBG_13_37_8]|uniref:Serine--tRNA ligase n=1 Tax=Candidatus Fischerbacteria bacterium RBG_13_37_8 TaxID=1817863 RepID=A0A1F5VJJ6_9BACT|nr:MAG: serine--tRNA ligase [Candidatus Fischerbacteria bacterium RBG_13_37_8]